MDDSLDEVGPVVATRVFELRSGGIVTANIHAPLQVALHEWISAFSIDGLLPEGSFGCAYGVDGLQALLLAANGLRIRMEALQEEFRWLGGEPMDSGIPRIIVPSFGLSFSKRMEGLIEEESTKLVAEARKRRRS